MDLYPKNETHVTLAFEDWREADYARHVVAPHLGAVARAGFFAKRFMAEASWLIRDTNHPVTVDLKVAELDGMLATIPNRIQELRAFAYEGDERIRRQAEFHVIQDVRHQVYDHLLGNERPEPGPEL